MAAVTARLPTGTPLPGTSSAAAEPFEVEADGLGAVDELGVLFVELEVPTRAERAGTSLKLAATELPLVQAEPGVVLAPATKLTAAHFATVSHGGLHS